VPEEELTPRVREWREQGELVELGGHHVYVHARPGSGPPLVFLHGFPSSSFDFRGVIQRLPGRRCIALDFLGFGLSDKPRDHDYTLASQADLVEKLVLRFADEAPLLVAHDMGTSVATELMARDIADVGRIAPAGALLFNGSILLHLASPTVGQRILRSAAGPVFARLAIEGSFRRQFARLFSPLHPLEPEEGRDQWCLLRRNGGNLLLPRLIGYMDERERFAERWHGAFRDWPGRLWLAWGLRDPVATPAVLAGLRRLRPQAPVMELPELGHYPQIEDPGAIAAAVESAAARVQEAR
jgi:pimeloyl-ACP methyl ester carboxylesterase